MRFAAAGQNEACGVSTESPQREGVHNAGFVALRAPGAEIQDFKVLTGHEMAEKWRCRALLHRVHNTSCGLELIG